MVDSSTPASVPMTNPAQQSTSRPFRDVANKFVAEPEGMEETWKLEEGISKMIMKMKKEFEPVVPIKILLDFLETRNLDVPGRSIESKSRYLVDLKARQAEILCSIEVDLVNFSLRYLNSTQIQAHVSDEQLKCADAKIIKLISSLKEPKFSLAELEMKAFKVGECVTMDRTKTQVSYALFVHFPRGDFMYDHKDPARDTIFNVFRGIDKDSAATKFGISLVHPTLTQPKGLIEVKISFFKDFDRFSLQTASSRAIFQRMEHKISQLDVEQLEEPYGGWRAGHACVVNIKIGQKSVWTRGYVALEENGYFRVYCLDYGYWKFARAEDIKFMPRRYMEVPPCGFQCELDIGPDELQSSYDGPWRKEMPNFSGKLFVAIKGRREKAGIPLFVVDLYTEGPNGDKINILNYNF